MRTLHQFREILRKAKSVPCEECGGVFHYAVMDADHRIPEDRLFSLSRPPSGTTMKEFLEELSKCDIICANCHRMRTFLSRAYLPKAQKKIMDAALAGSEQ